METALPTGLGGSPEGNLRGGGRGGAEEPQGAASAANPLAPAPGPCGSPPTPSSQARQGVRPLLPPTPHSLRSWLGSVKSRARQGGGGDVSAGIQAPLVRSDGPPPRLPNSTPPPLDPLLGAFWVAALPREIEQQP